MKMLHLCYLEYIPEMKKIGEKVLDSHDLY